MPPSFPGRNEAQPGNEVIIPSATPPSPSPPSTLFSAHGTGGKAAECVRRLHPMAGPAAAVRPSPSRPVAATAAAAAARGRGPGQRRPAAAAQAAGGEGQGNKRASATSFSVDMEVRDYELDQ